jgi:hypothetical protein
MQQEGILQELRSDICLTGYNATEPIQDQPVLSGSGYYLNLNATFKWFDLMVSYWNGEDYYAPFGGPLYGSVGWDYEITGTYQKERELLIGRVLLEHDLGDRLSLAFRFQPVYDIGNSLFEHMESLYLRYRTDFTLNRKRLP